MNYKCYGKERWNDKEKFLFTYTFLNEPPMSDDLISLDARELAGESFTTLVWVVEARRWHNGIVELIIGPKSDGLVMANL